MSQTVQGTIEFSSDLLCEDLSAMFASGNDRSAIERNAATALAPYGAARVNADDGTNNWLAADELRLRVRIALAQPVGTDRLAAAILQGANQFAPQTAEEPGWFSSLAGWGALRFRHDLVAGAIRDLQRVDGQSLTRPAAAAPRDGLIAAVASRTFGSTTTSTDPARDNQAERPPVGLPTPTLDGLPPAAQVGIVAGVAILSLFAIGYAAGGVGSLVGNVRSK